MANVTLARLLVRIGADASQFARAMYTTEQRFKKTARGLRTAGNALSIGVTAPLLAIAGASLKMAMDAEESENLFTVSMGKMAASAREWSEDLQKSLGLNGYELRRQVGEWNVLFTNMGLGEQQAFNMSKALVELGGDMASFYNFTGGAAEASEKLRSIMAGETEVARRLGIDVSAAAVSTAAYTKGIAEQGAKLTEQQKLFARYQILLKQTATAQGDLERTIDSSTNQLRIQKEQLKLAATELGNALIPSLQSAIPLITDFSSVVKAAAEALNSMDEESRRLALTIVGLIAIAGPATRVTSVLFAGFAGGAGIARRLTKSVRALVPLFPTLFGSMISTSSASLKVSAAMRTAAVAAGGLSAAVVLLIGGLTYLTTKELLESAGWYKSFQEALGLTADAQKQFVDQLRSSESAYKQQLDLYNSMRAQLRLVGDEWTISAERSDENARRLAELKPKVVALHWAYKGQVLEQIKSNESLQSNLALLHQWAAKLREQKVVVADVTGELAKMYGVMRQKDAEEQMSKLVADFTTLARDGVSAEQLLGAFGTRVSDLTDVANDYVGIDMPQQFRNLDSALKNPAYLNSFIDSLKNLGPETKRGVDQVIEILDAKTGAVKKSLSGGFGEGIEEGIARGAQAYEQFIAEIASRPIRVPFDVEDIQRQMNGALASPDTSGRLP